MILPPRARKSVLAVHLTVSVGWIGSVLAYLALGLQAANAAEVEMIRGSWVAMETIGWTVIIPLAVAAMVTGIVMAMGTRWRLLDHYWVVFSLVLTAAAIVVLILHMGDVEVLADIARTGDDAAVRRLGGDLVHTILALVVLIAVQVLNIYKPRGLTGRGRRRAAGPRRAAGLAATTRSRDQDVHR